MFKKAGRGHIPPKANQNPEILSGMGRNLAKTAIRGLNDQYLEKVKPEIEVEKPSFGAKGHQLDTKSQKSTKISKFSPDEERDGAT